MRRLQGDLRAVPGDQRRPAREAERLRLPRLDLVADPPGARDLVVLAHGGRQHSEQEPSDVGHTILRMWPFAAAATRAAPDAAVGFVRYRHRGWNDRGDPVDDLADVLDAAGRAGIGRIVLVGHSMGGRTAIACGGHDLVVGVVALAPWLPGDEPLGKLAGRTIVMAHGDRDRITSAALTARFVARLRDAGVSSTLLRAEGEAHSLLQRAGDWDELVARSITSSLTAAPDDLLAATSSTDAERPADPLPRWSRRRPLPLTLLAIAQTRRRLPVVHQIALD